MNERELRPASLAAAALLIGGVLVVAQPQHVMSIIRLVIVTVAAAAALHALAVNVPSTWWTSPFDRTTRKGREGDGFDELAPIRSKLTGRRQPLEDGPPLPPDALRLLKPMIASALQREGLDPGDETDLEGARTLLSPPTWAVLTSEPMRWPSRLRTHRPDEREVADAVHGVLDELELLAAGGRNPQPQTDTRHTRGT